MHLLFSHLLNYLRKTETESRAYDSEYMQVNTDMLQNIFRITRKIVNTEIDKIQINDIDEKLIFLILNFEMELENLEIKQKHPFDGSIYIELICKISNFDNLCLLLRYFITKSLKTLNNWEEFFKILFFIEPFIEFFEQIDENYVKLFQMKYSHDLKFEQNWLNEVYSKIEKKFDLRNTDNCSELNGSKKYISKGLNILKQNINSFMTDFNDFSLINSLILMRTFQSKN